MIDDKAFAAPRPEVVNRVVAWHNRHPLARRITAAQVRHVGLVVLPFAAKGRAPGLEVDPAPAPSAAPPTPEPMPEVVPEVVRQTALAREADESLVAAEPLGEPAPVATGAPMAHDTLMTTTGDQTATASETDDWGSAEVVVSIEDAPPEPVPAAAGAVDLALDDIAATDSPVAEPAADHAEPWVHGAEQVAVHSPGLGAIHDDRVEPSPLAASAGDPPLDGAVHLPWWQRLLQRLQRRRGESAGPTRLFSENLVPELGVKGLAAFAMQHGLTQLPPGEPWPMRAAELERDLQHRAADQGHQGRADRVLFTASIDDGTRRHRLLIGSGPKPRVAGPRLWDRQRAAALAGVGLVCLSTAAWALGRHAGHRAALAQAQAASAPIAASSASAAGSLASSAEAASRPPVLASAPAGASTASADLAASGAAPGQHDASASTAASTQLAAGVNDGGEHAAAGRSSEPRAPEAADPGGSESASAPPRSIVPSLRPQLARAAQVESAQRFALVSAPIRSGAQAQALLRLVREEASRVHHPVAVETSLHQSAQGWRVSWWPFANQRQAANARAALADRHLEMDVVEF